MNFMNDAHNTKTLSLKDHEVYSFPTKVII